MVPKNIIILWLTLFTGLTSSDSSEVENIELTVVDHLVGDLDKEASHSLVGVVVSGNGVDHFDTVHQSWEGLFD